MAPSTTPVVPSGSLSPGQQHQRVRSVPPGLLPASKAVSLLSVKVGQLLALLRTMLKWLIQMLAWVYFGPVQWDPAQQEHPHTAEIHQCTSAWEAAARNTGVSQRYSSNSHGAHVCDSAPRPPALLHHYISELTQETQSNRQLNVPSFCSQWSSTCSREARARAVAPVTGTRSHPPERAGVVTWQPPAGRTWVCWSSL